MFEREALECFLSMVCAGTLSGRVSEWPQLVPAIKMLLADRLTLGNTSASLLKDAFVEGWEAGQCNSWDSFSNLSLEQEEAEAKTTAWGKSNTKAALLKDRPYAYSEGC